MSFLKFKLSSLLAMVFSITMVQAHGAEDTLQLQQIADFADAIDESSGLAVRNNVYWTINDSGNGADLFKLDAEGNHIGTVTITNAVNRDWEALAQDEQYLYIADTGNNFNRKRVFTIYRLAWASLEQPYAEAEFIVFTYGDHRAGISRSHNFDSEALAVRGNEFWLFTKNRGDSNTNLYRFPKEPGEYSPMPSQSLPIGSMATGADIHAATGDLVIVSNRRTTSGLEKKLWHAPTTDEGVDWDEARSFRLAPVDQWEGVTWSESGDKLIFSHESNARESGGFAATAGTFPR